MINLDIIKAGIREMRLLVEMYESGVLVEEEEKPKPIRKKDGPILKIDNPKCPKCGSNVIKCGKRYNKHEIKQKYHCLDCEHKFVKDSTKFKFPRYVREYIKAMDKSSRKIAKDVYDKFGFKISHATVVRIKNLEFEVDRDGYGK